MGMGMTFIPIWRNSHRRIQCLAYVIAMYSLLWHLLFIMTILLLMTIMFHLIETVRFTDKLSTMIFYVSGVLDASKMFMLQRLNDCMEWEGMGQALCEFHGNGNCLQNCEWGGMEGMGIDHMGIGGSGNVKSHSRSSLLWGHVELLVMKWPYLENEMFTLVLLITALTETFWRVKELLVTKKINAVKNT